MSNDRYESLGGRILEEKLFLFLHFVSYFVLFERRFGVFDGFKVYGSRDWYRQKKAPSPTHFFEVAFTIRLSISIAYFYSSSDPCRLILFPITTLSYPFIQLHTLSSLHKEPQLILIHIHIQTSHRSFNLPTLTHKHPNPPRHHLLILAAQIPPSQPPSHAFIPNSSTRQRKKAINHYTSPYPSPLTPFSTRHTSASCNVNPPFSQPSRRSRSDAASTCTPRNPRIGSVFP